jgi:hypothetical protein
MLTLWCPQFILEDNECGAVRKTPGKLGKTKWSKVQNASLSRAVEALLSEVVAMAQIASDRRVNACQAVRGSRGNDIHADLHALAARLATAAAQPQQRVTPDPPLHV